MLGQDILNNAVHASTDVEKARELMVPIFGDLKFNDDGTLKGKRLSVQNNNIHHHNNHFEIIKTIKDYSENMYRKHNIVSSDTTSFYNSLIVN